MAMVDLTLVYPVRDYIENTRTKDGSEKEIIVRTGERVWKNT